MLFGVVARSRRWLLDDPTSGNRTLCYTTQAREPSVCRENFLTKSLLISGRLTRPIAIHLSVGAVELETNKTLKQHWRLAEGKDNGSIYQFDQ